MEDNTFFCENKNKHLQIFNKYCLNPSKMMFDSKLKTELLYQFYMSYNK